MNGGDWMASLWSGVEAVRQEAAAFSASLLEENKDTVEAVRRVPMDAQQADLGAISSAAWNALARFGEKGSALVHAIEASMEEAVETGTYSPVEVSAGQRALLQRLKTTQETYTLDPLLDNGDIDPQFEAYRDSFDLEKHMDNVKAILESDTDVTEIHQRLVPSSVQESEFWSRYLYGVFKLEQNEARRLAMEAKMRSGDATPTSPASDSDSWSDAGTETEEPPVAVLPEAHEDTDWDSWE